MTIDDLKIYYVNEYRSTKLFLENPPAWANVKKVLGNTYQRMLGAAMLAQHCGVTYAEIDELYYKYQQKVEALGGKKNV